MRLDHLLSRENGDQKWFSKPEVDAALWRRRRAGLAGKSLTDIFLHYIVLRDRMVASRDRRGRMGAFAHLENCTGKTNQ